MPAAKTDNAARELRDLLIASGVPYSAGIEAAIRKLIRVMIEEANEEKRLS